MEYQLDDYHYSKSFQTTIADAQGGIYRPYTATWFDGIKGTDIEHIVARSKAHDSGLCAADADTKDEFASDLLNLTLASPSVNRHQKVDKDVREWLPALNQCWYVDRTIQVRLEYGLTIDHAEADTILSGCITTEIVMLATTTKESTTAIGPVQRGHPTSEYMRDADGDGVLYEQKPWHPALSSALCQ